MQRSVTRTGVGKTLVLEDGRGFYGDLVEIATGTKKRKETINTLRGDLAEWMKNAHFNPIRGKMLDIGIVAYVNKQRMNMQDVDNIAKVVLDSLKRPRNEKNETRWLFDDDAQVMRLIIQKIQQETINGVKTDQAFISFREHDPEKQMILISKSDF